MNNIFRTAFEQARQQHIIHSCLLLPVRQVQGVLGFVGVHHVGKVDVDGSAVTVSTVPQPEVPRAVQMMSAHSDVKVGRNVGGELGAI